MLTYNQIIVIGRKKYIVKKIKKRNRIILKFLEKNVDKDSILLLREKYFKFNDSYFEIERVFPKEIFCQICDGEYYENLLNKRNLRVENIKKLRAMPIDERKKLREILELKRKEKKLKAKLDYTSLMAMFENMIRPTSFDLFSPVRRKQRYE